MANLIRLTVKKDSKLVNAGSFSFNTARIKKVYANGTGSIVYYVDGTDQKSKITKFEVTEAPATINEDLTGSLDFQIELNVLLIEGDAHVRTENIKTSDILYGIIDPTNSNHSWLWISDISLNKTRYVVDHTLDVIEILANNYSISGGGSITNIDFNPLVGIALNNVIGTIYNLYTQLDELELTIASGSTEGGKAKLIIEADGNDFSITGVTQNPKSDSFDTTIGNRNLIEFEVIAEIVFY